PAGPHGRGPSAGDRRGRRQRSAPRLHRHRHDRRPRTGDHVSSTVPFESAVAAAFAARLPTATPTSAVAAAHGSGDTGDAVIVGFVGEAGAQLAVQILEPDALVDGLPDTPLAERLHSALESAVGALGAGRLGEAAFGDASEVFSHPATQL